MEDEQDPKREGSIPERPEREDGLSAGELGGQTDPREDEEQAGGAENPGDEALGNEPGPDAELETEEHREKTQQQVAEAFE